MAGPAPAFLTARWEHLLMANYELEPSVLEPFVPQGTELDLWRGRCFASVVGFRFLDTRVMGLALPWHRDFEEVNLRFYVKRAVDGALRRGVVFIKELVPRRAIAWLANALYNEKYVALPMSHELHLDEPARTIAYRWHYAKRACQLSCALDGDPYQADESAEESFITEHYWGYTAQRDGSTLEYRVEHPRWQVWQAKNAELTCDVTALYGARFAPFLRVPPASCFVADGSAIVVRRGVRI